MSLSFTRYFACFAKITGFTVAQFGKRLQYGFRDHMLARPAMGALYPVPVRRVAVLLWRFLQTITRGIALAPR
jgi:hypothetical protein